MACLTFVYVVCTIIMVMAMLSGNKTSILLFDHPVKLEIDAKRPIIWFYLQIQDREVFAIIRNYGNGVARKIRIRTNKPFKFIPDAGTWSGTPLLRDEIEFLAPQRYIADRISPSVHFYRDNDPPKFLVNLKYEDQSGETYTEEYTIDLQFGFYMSSTVSDEDKVRSII